MLAESNARILAHREHLKFSTNNWCYRPVY